MPHEVFISYADEDKSVAEDVCAALEERGIRCWIACRNMHGGGEWESELLRAIERSSLVVLIFSRHANRSKILNCEIHSALEAEKKVIPFRIEDAPLEDSLRFRIRRVHWLDAFTPPIEAHIKRLVADVHWMLRAPDPESVDASSPPIPKVVPEPRSGRLRRLLRSDAALLGLVLLAVLLSFAAGTMDLNPLRKPPSPAQHASATAGTARPSWEPWHIKQLDTAQKTFLMELRRPNVHAGELLTALESEAINRRKNPSRIALFTASAGSKLPIPDRRTP